MTQVTWRAPVDLVDQVKQAAAREGRSVNEFLTLVARAAVDPDYAGEGVERTRERLARAGLLVRTHGPRARPSAKQVAAARAAAGRGEALSDIVSSERG